MPTHLHICATHTPAHTYSHSHIHTLMRTPAHIDTHTYTHIYTYNNLHTPTYTLTYTCLHYTPTHTRALVGMYTFLSDYLNVPPTRVFPTFLLKVS